ncbi:MAG: proteasome assembly chaperone family protein, partial [Rhodoluna sp.]
MSAQIFSGRTLIVAFEGWNDAAESASGVVKFLCERIKADVVAAVDPEDYYDFQFTRPTVSYDADGGRTLDWPGTEMCIPSAEAIEENPGLAKLTILVGTEPARRWKSFAAEIMEMVEDRDIDSVLFLGAMLADVPHSRPIGVMSTSQNEHARQELEIEKSQYEGPVGILSVLGIELEKAGIPAVALWASVPHYVHNTPSPKATLSLLIEVEKLLGVQFDHGNLAEEAFAWERGIDEIAEADDEMANYISQLEKTRDEVESVAATGESLAKEFEKFLRAETKPE